ncbi:MAG: glycosyltransferase [Candidatus Aminicenantales bacterium]|jgi:glycosyltransferase involved in cell wall biosynthesis
MLLSLIVPVYNVEKYLPACIDSLLKQSLTDFEVILIDDGSIDRSGAICDEYAQADSRIRVIHKQNGGLSSARNAGLEIAQGKFVGFVDSDDGVSPCMYEVLCATSEKYRCDTVAADYVSSTDELCCDSIAALKTHAEIFEDREKILAEYFSHRGNHLCAMLFNRRLFDGLAFEVGRHSEDVIPLYKLALKAEKVARLKLPLYYYNQDSESLCRSQLKVKDFYSIEATRSVAEDVRGQCPAVFDKAILHCYKAIFNIVNKYAMRGATDDAAKQLKKSVRGYKSELRGNFSAVLGSDYFSKNDKLQIAVLCISFNGFCLLKQLYKKGTNRQVQPI